jgi:hypothetical protein
MQPTVIVAFVNTRSTPEESIRRLVQATNYSDTMLSHSALRTLVALTAMAHPTHKEGDIVSQTVPTADLDQLEQLGFIAKPEDSIGIELI